MESEKRWCRICMSDAQHEILDSGKVMVGKKTKFLYKCTICGRVSRMPSIRGMAESTYQKNQFLECEFIENSWVCIVEYIVLNMKYMCKSCRKPCTDIVKHIRKVHNFSESYINDQLKTNSNSYKNAFEEINQVREFAKTRDKQKKKNKTKSQRVC